MTVNVSRRTTYAWIAGLLLAAPVAASEMQLQPGDPAALESAAPSPADPARTTRLQGRLYLDRRTPVTGATAVVTPVVDAPRVYLAASDGQGIFRVEGLTDGDYGLRVERDGLDPVVKTDVAVKFPFRAVIELPMRRSEEARPPAHAAAPFDGSTRVRLDGLVLGPGGLPLEDVRVRLVRPDGAVDPRLAETAADGRFTLEDLAAGPWAITLDGVGMLKLRTTLDLVETTALEAALAPQPADYLPSPLELMPVEEPLPPPARSEPDRTAK
jgi:hypothetical protein